jgi:hypothetical protein
MHVHAGTHTWKERGSTQQGVQAKRLNAAASYVSEQKNKQGQGAMRATSSAVDAGKCSQQACIHDTCN